MSGPLAVGPSDLSYDAIHANYWLSGLAGHQLKHELDLPLVSTFHTLDRVKAESSPEEMSSDEPHRRAEAEASVMACSEVVLASCSVEADQLVELYGADPDRIRVVPPGVDHAFFAPGSPAPGPQGGRASRVTARCSPSSGGSSRSRAPTSLFGSSKPCFPTHSDAQSGRGRRAERPSWRGAHGGAASVRGVERPDGKVRFVAPQPHELLSTYYRAADVCLVPSRSESFGLVALESAACGTPVVAAVGRRTYDARRGRMDRLPRGRSRRRRLSPAPQQRSWTIRLRRRPCRPTPSFAPGTSPGRRQRASCGLPTRSWLPSVSWGADSSRFGVYRPMSTSVSPIATPEERARCDAAIAAWAASAGCRRRCPCRRPRPGSGSLVHPAQGRREGRRDHLAHRPSAHAAPRDALHAGSRDQRLRDLPVPAAPQLGAAGGCGSVSETKTRCTSSASSRSPT